MIHRTIEHDFQNALGETIMERYEAVYVAVHDAHIEAYKNGADARMTLDVPAHFAERFVLNVGQGGRERVGCIFGGNVEVYVNPDLRFDQLVLAADTEIVEIHVANMVL